MCDENWTFGDVNWCATNHHYIMTSHDDDQSVTDPDHVKSLCGDSSLITCISYYKEINHRSKYNRIWVIWYFKLKQDL